MVWLYKDSIVTRILMLRDRELAELLGQVKPPVATREDIDKSGLQIIKSTDLEQYEKEGRVAANCIDRVCFMRLFHSCPE